MSGWKGTNGPVTVHLGAVSRTHDQFEALFRRQPRGQFGRSFSYVFVLYGSIKAITGTIHK